MRRRVSFLVRLVLGEEVGGEEGEGGGGREAEDEFDEIALPFSW